MSGPKPTHGYASRTDAVVGMLADGLSQQEIAGRLGIDAKTVSALECSARRRSGERRGPPAGPRDTEISLTVRRLLRPHAARRCLTVDALVTLIVEKVAHDRLVDAVLDDEDTIQ